MAEPTEILRTLDASLAAEQRRIALYDAYYEGEQPIRFMAPAMRREFGDRITALVINLARIGADAYENRLDIEGFRFAGDDSRDQVLHDAWQANDLDEQSQQGHLECVALSRSYVCVGSSDSPEDPPVVTVEHPSQAFVQRDPRTRKGRAGIKRWVEEDGTQWGVLYLPNSTGVYRYGSEGWALDSPADEHNLGRLPMVPLVNRPRILRPNGVSEFHDVIPIMDAVNKMATDMMVSGEYHAMPRRWATGLKESDFVDADGNQISPWSMTAGHVWATEDKDVSVGQFPESDLAVFHNTIKVLVQVASMTMALPPHYLAFTSDNPTSADAIRSSETQLVKRVERKHTFLGGAWEEVMRLVLRFQTGEFETRAMSLETMWRDPSTPTVAQKADAVLKLATPLANGQAIVPIEQAREDLGYSPEQRRRMAKMSADQSADPTLERIARDLSAAASGNAVA